MGRALHEVELALGWDLAQRLEPLAPIDPLPSIKVMLGVTKVSPLADYVLRIEFNDGRVGDVDGSFLLSSGLGVELRDLSYFRRVSVDPDLQTVVWPNGLDPAPELLYRRLTAAAGSSAA